MNFKFVSSHKTKGPVISLMLNDGTIYAGISRKQTGDLPEVGILAVGAGKGRRKSLSLQSGKKKLSPRVDEMFYLGKMGNDIKGL